MLGACARDGNPCLDERQPQVDIADSPKKVIAMKRLSAALVSLTLMASPALADYLNRVVPAGGVMRGNFYLAINPDCSLVAYPTVRLVSSPANGVVSLKQGKAFPFFPAVNPRSACNRTRVPAILLEYRPNQGFVGSDSFEVNAIFPIGAERADTFNITVK